MKRRERKRFRWVKDKRNDEYISISVVTVAGEEEEEEDGEEEEEEEEKEDGDEEVSSVRSVRGGQLLEIQIEDPDYGLRITD